jgi:hypothetical protein
LVEFKEQLLGVLGAQVSCLLQLEQQQQRATCNTSTGSRAGRQEVCTAQVNFLLCQVTQSAYE